jgi:hypothetical protein
MWKIPMTKTQIPMKSQNSNPNEERSGALVIGIWKLGFHWDLGFGHWDLQR